LDVVAHQIELVHAVLAGRMHGDFGRRQPEDQPSAAHIDVREREHVAQERAIGIGTRAVDDRMRADEHGLGHFVGPCNAIMAASEASFWSLPQGGPTDFPSEAIVFRKLFTEGARARSACSSSCFLGIPRNLKSHALAARASASRNSTPSALCIRKCTARLSSMVQSGMGSTTSTAQAAPSCAASRASLM